MAPSPEHTENGLEVADDYAAELMPMMDIGWQFPATYGQSDPDDNSGLTPEMAGPFKKLLVIELCAYFGKEVPNSIMMTANAGMRHLEQLIISVPDAQNPATLPYGSGNEHNYYDRRFYNESPDNEGALYVLEGDILNYSYDFTRYPNWLVDDVLDTVTWELSNSGISTSSIANTDTVASAELTFVQNGGCTVYISATKAGSTDKLTVTQNFIINRKSTNGLSFT